MKLIIRKLRQERKITQDQLSEATGVAQATISCLENEAWKSAGVETLRPIAEFFGLSIEQLYDQDDAADQTA